MSLEEKWIKAKKEYDAEVAEAEKVVAKLKKERDALRKQAEKLHKKYKVKEKLDSLIKDPVQARMSGQDLLQVINPLRAKIQEIEQIRAPQPRKRTGAEPAFREVDKVLKVGVKLGEANVTDPKKWKAWLDLAVSSLKSCAKAEQKFNAWLGRPTVAAEKNFQQAFQKIHAKMRAQGTPILRHAQGIIGKGQGDAS